MIICLIIGVSHSAEVNLILIKYIFSGTMKAVLVIICLIIGVSNFAEVNLILIHIFRNNEGRPGDYLSVYMSLLFC